MLKMLAAAVSGATIAGVFVVMHADTPWFGVGSRESFSAASSQVTFAPGQSLVVVSIPITKQLTITDVGAVGTGNGSAEMLELDERNSTGGDVTRVPEGFVYGPYSANGTAVSHSNGHGVVFGPGTDVVLKFDSTSLYTFTGSYFLVGYWTDK